MPADMGYYPAGKAKHVAKTVNKKSHAYLGHFANSSVLKAGHNTIAHPGFQAAESKIAKREDISMDRAGAILAASSRRASSAAKKANPRLKRVKG